MTDPQKIIQICVTGDESSNYVYGLNGNGEMHTWEWDKKRQGYYWKWWPNIGEPQQEQPGEGKAEGGV